MVKALQSKRWTIVSLSVVFAMLAGLIALGAKYYFKFDFYEKKTVFIEGSYSVDDGDWQPIDPDKPIVCHGFHKVVFKGKLLQDMSFFTNINISTKNIWYTLKTADGTVLFSHIYTSKEEYLEYLYSAYITGSSDPDDPMLDKDYFFENYPIEYTLDMHLPDTPGYCVESIDTDYLKNLGVTEDTELILELDNPYRISRTNLSDTLEVTLSFANGSYLQFFFEALPMLLLFVLVCFFGVFLFPIAGFILGKINYKYITFGVLCLFWGLYMIAQGVGDYMNLWITDCSVCMLFEFLLNYLFIVAVLFYLRSNLVRPVTRSIATISATVYLLVVIAAVVLHFTGVLDMYATTPNVYIVTAVCTVVITVMLIVEGRSNRQMIFFLASWTPLTLSIILDVANRCFSFTDIHFYIFGSAITMLYQIFRLIRDLKKQYKETIRYQQMQKELYEAKVSIMVSQIQPHFLYNSLSSIAMLCKLDPDTAQKATITFTKYLRGNMDSLKQTTPVPFERELDHLEKYLYIEKLRFADKLNIAYDIQCTDFELPLLSVQPLVENAVKHGVGMKEEGGTVTIATRETDTAYEVIVSDDGVGFDTEAHKNDGRSHVGMENTRKRLKDMCNAEVEITSVIGEGTVARVIIPKEEKHK